MRSWAVREGASVSEQEVWLRRAVDGGDTFAIVLLGQLAEEQGMFDDAEYWYRLAYDRDEPGARDRLSNLFRRRGRLSEAVAFFRPGAERGCSADTWQLVIALKEMGREQEAATWQELYDRQYVDEHGRSAPSQSGITIAVAAVVTTAVMPFIQTLVAKVAEDTYEQARGLVRRMLRRGEPRVVWHPETGTWHVRGE